MTVQPEKHSHRENLFLRHYLYVNNICNRAKTLARKVKKYKACIKPLLYATSKFTS